MRVKFLCYEGTMQTACLRLMGKKLLAALPEAKRGADFSAASTRAAGRGLTGGAERSAIVAGRKNNKDQLDRVAASRSCRAHEIRPSRRTDAHLQAGAYRLIEMLRACTRVFATS